MTKIFTLFLLCFAQLAIAQTLQVRADNYLQVFKGAGISAGLYMGHHYSMTAAAQDSAVRLIARDLNLVYLMDYIDRYPADDTAYFTRRANYIKACKLFKPNLQICQVGNKFPDLLMKDTVIGGTSRRVLRTEDTAIYTKVADWYFQMWKAFKERGVDVDVLNVVNEPDFDKQYYYGANGATQQNVALIFDRAVPRFFAMIANPALNTIGIKKPLIMGPSTISPDGCLSYMRYFKNNWPSVWAMLDIVTYHQYVDGVDVNTLATIKVEANGKPVYQNEMHTNRGDALGTLPISDELRGCLSLASVYGNSLRTGANSWFYFQTNYPNPYTPAGLLSTPWQSTTVTPYKHYYAFRQLTSTQPMDANVLEHIRTNASTVDVVCFRKQGADSVYVNATNLSGTARTMTFSVLAATGRYKLLRYSLRTTNATLNDSVVAVQNFATPADSFVVTLSPYSVNTLTIGLQNASVLDLPTPPAPTFPTPPATDIVVFVQGNALQIISKQLSLEAVQIVGADGQMLHAQSGIRDKRYSWMVGNMASGLGFVRIKTKLGWEVKKVMFKR